MQAFFVEIDLVWDHACAEYVSIGLYLHAQLAFWVQWLVAAHLLVSFYVETVELLILVLLYLLIVCDHAHQFVKFVRALNILLITGMLPIFRKDSVRWLKILLRYTIICIDCVVVRCVYDRWYLDVHQGADNVVFCVPVSSIGVIYVVFQLLFQMCRISDRQLKLLVGILT